MVMKLITNENEGEKVPDICGTSIELVNSTLSGSKLLSIAIILLEPANKSTRHFHKNTEEVYYILEGEGEILIDDMKSRIVSGDTILLPIGSKHQIINTGNKLLKFISIDSPVFDELDVFIC